MSVGAAVAVGAVLGLLLGIVVSGVSDLPLAPEGGLVLGAARVALAPEGQHVAPGSSWTLTDAAMEFGSLVMECKMFRDQGALRAPGVRASHLADKLQVCGLRSYRAVEEDGQGALVPWC